MPNSPDASVNERLPPRAPGIKQGDIVHRSQMSMMGFARIVGMAALPMW